MATCGLLFSNILGEIPTMPVGVPHKRGEEKECFTFYQYLSIFRKRYRQTRLYVGAGGGNCPLTSALPSNVLVTAVTHQHVRTKRAFCGLNSTPKFVSDRGSARTPLRELRTLSLTP